MSENGITHYCLGNGEPKCDGCTTGDQAQTIVALRAALKEIAEWTERYTTPGHPIATVARRALEIRHNANVRLNDGGLLKGSLMRKDTEVYLAGSEHGPVVTFSQPCGEVTVTWAAPPTYTKHRKVHPPITSWDEYDAACYSLGKSILDHFTGKRSSS